jgi:hypothetical protein
MSASPLIIERLTRVTQHGSDRWRAECPAHESRQRTQSLSIRELPDGTLLLHCFAGCGAADVVQAAGLSLRDLFPLDHRAPQDPRHAGRPRHWHALREAVQTLRLEALVVTEAVESIRDGRGLTARDLARVVLAGERIEQALEACR